MEALRASYASSDSDSDSDTDPGEKELISLPPPPPDLLDSTGLLEPGVRVRNFPHVEGNYALHVYIPVAIPELPKKEIARFLIKLASLVPHLHLVEADVPLTNNDHHKLEHALSRDFHISLGRSVPLRVHQITSVLSLLRQKLHSHTSTSTSFLIDFNNWQVFVNDDSTRSFLSLEVTSSGLSQITKLIDAVNQVYKLHNLPQFYQDPRPHISLVWALGDISTSLNRQLTKLPSSHNHRIFTSKFCGIECKIGNKTHKICKPSP